MSAQPPSQTDISILTQIIQLANHRYLHQSRIHKNSSFNILRILSAYKQISEKYSARKDKIYNWIIYITRNYNPQRYGQWISAVKDLTNNSINAHGRNKSNSGYGYINNSLSTSNINAYTNPHNSNNISRSQSVQAHHHHHHNATHQVQRKTSTKQYSQKNIVYNSTNNNNNYSISTNTNNHLNNYIKNKPSLTPQNNQQFGNTYSQQDYQQSIYNKHLADISVNYNNPNTDTNSQCYHYSYSNNYPNNSNNNNHSHTNYNSNKSHQILNYTDEQFKLIPPVSSKLHHYISFEPDSENKQNINSANLNNQQNKSDTMNQPTRTPGQQSFIHNLPLSYGSPFILSKITNNTKEVTEVQLEQDQQEQTVEWVNMKARADIFYGINLKFKVFSALLANFQAFESFQEVLKKTRKFRKKLFFSRFYKSAKSFLNHQKQKQQYLNSATNYYQHNLLKKSFKILQIFHQLKIKTHKPILIQKFNPTNFEFLITLIFSSAHHLEQYQPVNPVHDTPKSIREKSRYFQNLEDSQKMGIISEYFLSNLKLSKEQIHGLFEMHRKARKEKIWRILKNNVRYFKKQQELLSTMRKRIAMRYLTKYHKNTLKNNVRIKIMQTSKQRTLKQKSFNALCEFLMSKKIYMKRQEFLRNSHRNLIMMNIMRQWRMRKQQVQIKKLGRNACVEKGTSILLRTILNKYMKFMIDRHEQLKIKQAEQIKTSNRLLCQQIFSFLKQRAKQRKHHNTIKTTKNTGIKKQILVNWLKLTKFCISVKKINRIFTLQAFKTIERQTELMEKQRRLTVYLRQQKERNMLKQLRISFNLDKTQIQNKIAKTWKMIQKDQFLIFANISKNYVKQAKKTRRQNQLQAYQKLTKQALQKNRKSLALSLLRSNRMSIMSYNKKEEIIQSVMGNRRINFMQNTEEGEEGRGQTYTRCHLKMKKEVFMFLRENTDYKASCIKLSERLREKSHNLVTAQLKNWQRSTKLGLLTSQIQKTRANKFSKNTLSLLKKLHQASKDKSGRSVAHHEKSLKFKTLLSFAKSIMYSSNLQTTLKNKISINRKSRQGKFLINELSKKYSMKSKSQKLSKLLFIKQLQNNTNSIQDLEQKSCKLIKFLKKNHIKRLPFSRLLSLEHKIATQFLQQAYKKFAIMKVNHAIFRHILSQKQLYMAIKFKALHLCRLSFKSLLLNKQQNNPRILANSKKFKIHEHISTSYSSL